MNQGHQYIKGNPSECYMCGLEKGSYWINRDDKPCPHPCESLELHGDGRWVWCPKCKVYLESRIVSEQEKK